MHYALEHSVRTKIELLARASKSVWRCLGQFVPNCSISLILLLSGRERPDRHSRAGEVCTDLAIIERVARFKVGDTIPIKELPISVYSLVEKHDVCNPQQQN
jgi:hypothetical protein